MVSGASQQLGSCSALKHCCRTVVCGRIVSWMTLPPTHGASKAEVGHGCGVCGGTWSEVPRSSRLRESVGESEVPQGTPATAMVSETRVVPPLENKRSPVLGVVAFGAPRFGQECRDG